jgi:hypothetical protein
MAGQVQIVISVDDKGAISALQQVGAQAKQLGPAFQKSGAQGNVVFTELTKQTQQAHDASTLFSRLLGVQLPRQLDTFIAKSRTLAPVFANLFNAAIIASFVVAIATALASLIEQWQAYADAVKNAQREIQKAAGQEETQLLEQTLAKNRQLRLSAESSLATELQKADLKFHADRQATLEELFRAEGLARITGETDVVRRLNEQLGLLDQEHLASRKRLLIIESGAVQQAKDDQVIASSRGMARIAAEEKKSLDDVVNKRRLGALDYAQGEAQRAAIHAQTNEKIRQFDRDLSDFSRAINASGVQAILEARAGEARGSEQIDRQYAAKLEQIVEEEETLRRQALERGFDIQVNLNDKRYAAEIEHQARLAELRRSAANETAKLEEQAATAILPPWQRTYAQIAMTAQENQRQIDQAFQRTEISSDDAARRTAANWQIAWAQTRDTLASTIEGFFDDITSGNIGRRFLQMFKHQVAEMVASWILGLQGMRQSAAGAFGGGGGGSGGGGILGAIFGSLFGGNRGGANMGAATPPFFPVGGSAASALPLSMLTPGAFSQGGGNGISGVGLGSGFDLFGMGSPIGPGGTAPFNGPLSSGVGARIGSTLPSGSTIGSPLSVGANSIKIGGLLIPKAMLGTLALFGGLTAAGKIGFGSPGRGAISGALAGLGIGVGLAATGGFGIAALAGLAAVPGIGWIAAGIGAVIGLIAGLFGGAARRRKREALEREVVEQAKKIEDAYKVFQLDYGSANSQLEQLRSDELTKLAQIGSKDKSTQDARVNRHIDQTEKEIQAFEAERARRTQLISTLPLPEFAAGGFTSAAGPMLALLHPREAVLNPTGRAALGDSAITALNRGAAPGSTVAPNITVNISVVAPQGMDMRKLSQEIGRRFQSTMADQGFTLARA